MLASLKRLLSTGKSGVAPTTASAPGSTEEQPPEIAAFYAASTVRALQRIAERGIEVGTVVDIGASNGMWSAAAMPVLPSSARYLLVEAQVGHLDSLYAFKQQHANTDYVLAAAGDEEGEIYFDDSNLFGGLACKEQSERAKIRVPMITIDAEIARRSLPGPYLIKLDTHGFEVPILRGAKETLRSASLVVIETYNFRIAPGSLLFHEMCKYMEELGFGVIDISEPLWRTYDQSFWQFDLFFVPLSRREFSHVSYA